jgi:hypothetical protein
MQTLSPIGGRANGPQAQRLRQIRIVERGGVLRVSVQGAVRGQ